MSIQIRYFTINSASYFESYNKIKKNPVTKYFYLQTITRSIRYQRSKDIKTSMYNKMYKMNIYENI